MTTTRNKAIEDALRNAPCPRPMNDRPADETAGTCYDAKCCGCEYGAALALPEDDGWRDIESAPVDEPVLLFCPERHFTNRQRIELGTACTSRGSHHPWATHWHRAPAPPKEG